MDLARRDAILRAYLTGRDWDRDPGRILVRRLATTAHPALARWPLLVDHDWVAIASRGSEGIGGLVFGDGNGQYAVVESTSLPDADDRALPRRRATLRTSVRHRAIDHATAWLKATPDARGVAALTAVEDKGVLKVALEYEFRR
jgi:hypothetical protein